MYLPLLEEAIGQEAWPRSVVTHLDLETPGQTLAKMEGIIAVIARVSSMVFSLVVVLSSIVKHHCSPWT